MVCGVSRLSCEVILSVRVVGVVAPPAMINSRRLSAVEDFCTDHYLLKIDSAHIFNSLAASDEWKSDAADPLHKSPIPDPVLPEKLRWHLQTSSIPYVVQGPQLVFAFSGILFEGFEAQGSTVLRANGTVRIRKELKQRVAAVLNDVHQHYVVGRWAVSDEGYVSLVARVSEEVEEASDGALDWGLVRMQQAMEDVVPQLQPFVAHAEQVCGAGRGGQAQRRGRTALTPGPSSTCRPVPPAPGLFLVLRLPHPPGGGGCLFQNGACLLLKGTPPEGGGVGGGGPRVGWWF